MNGKSLIWVLLLCGPAVAADYKVSSAAEIAGIAGKLRPGDSVIMADGVWMDQQIVFGADGSEKEPITLRAQSGGGVILAGQSSVKIQGQYLVVSGLHLKDSQVGGDAINLSGSHNRVSECAVSGAKSKCKFFVHIFGHDNRVDHCYLAEKTSENPTVQVEVEEKRANNHLIDHNHFGHRPPLGKNGGETMRVGYSFQSMFSSKTTVESNLFDQCDGEIEIISSKSCDNIYRNNTFNNCAGFLTLRHGNRCKVDGNIFLGQGKKGSGGVRIIGEDHSIANNYFADLADGVFRITSGIPDSELKGYFQAKRCAVEGNTAVNCRGAYLEIDAGIGTSRRTLRPENITIAKNIFILPEKGASLIKGKEGEGWKWADNIAFGPELEGDYRGFAIKKPELKQAPAPLTAKDVGPSWSVDIRSQAPHNSPEEIK